MPYSTGPQSVQAILGQLVTVAQYYPKRWCFIIRFLLTDLARRRYIGT